MKNLITEGIILQKVSYLEKKEIFHLYTPDRGLFHAIGSKNTFDPLSRVEIEYQEGRGELKQCKNIFLLEGFLQLRKEFSLLSVSLDCLESLKRSQEMDQSAPPLYALLLLYFKLLPTSKDPWVFGLSFRMKLLLFEGLLTESFLLNEKRFNDEERVIAKKLTFARSIEELPSEILESLFIKKIKELFDELMR